MVQGAKLFGMQLVAKANGMITLFNMISKEKKVFKLKYEMPFEYDRKRMSVIVKDSQGVYHLMTKGSDSIML